MVRPSACDRARTWASLRLDGELSELEEALLTTHLGRCERCRGAVERMELATVVVRDEPLVRVTVQPALARLPRRSGSLRAFYAAAVSTVAAAAIFGSVGFIGAFHIVTQAATPPKLHHVSAVASGMSETQLLAHVRVLRLERPVPGRILWPA